MNNAINKSNLKTFFTVIPTVGMTDGQKRIIGGVCENLEGIVGASFDHTSPEFSSLIAAKALELYSLVGTAYVGPTWNPGKAY